MRMSIACGLTLVFAGMAQAQGLRLYVVEAESGKPIAGASVERWASQWQPRILRLPSKFWFPDKAVIADKKGTVVINKIAGDDWYVVKADGYEEGKVEKTQGKYLFTPRAGGKAQELIEKAGVVTLPLKSNEPKRI